MATLGAAVELPTGRESLVDFPLTASIHDTNWNVLSNEGKLTRGNSKASNAPEQAGRTSTYRSSRPASRGRQSVSARPSPARELPPQELDAGPVSYFPPRTQSSLSQSTWNASSTQLALKEAGAGTGSGHNAQTSDDSTGSTSGASTAGTNSLQESQVYALPANTESKEGWTGSPIILPTRSANSSVRSKVPTSKYKKKPPAAVKSSLSRRSGIETPMDSPMSSYTHLIQSPTLAEMPGPLLPELPSSSTVTSPSTPSETQTRQGQAPLHHTKSTASVRKARALHSHPSMPALRPGDPASSPMIPEPSPQTAVLRNRKSMDAPRSRPSLVDLQSPTPAPNTPLPDLPTGIQPLSRPGSSHVMAQPQLPADVHVRPGTSSSAVAPILRRQDTNQQSHTEMANFMTSTSKIIFRKFHDVHVRLLLNLQDEISALEKELAEIESVDGAVDPQREARKVKILSELRKLLAEYDHLFSNCNMMQASKADLKTREELEQWLRGPGNEPSSGLSDSAKEDLQWLQQHDDDLCSIDLNAKKKVPVVVEKEIPRDRLEETTTKSESVVATRTGGISSGGGGKGGGGGGGGGGGFASLFASCAGKRK